MDEKQLKDNEIEELTQDIEAGRGSAELFLRRGKLFYSQGARDKALNDFLRVLEAEPANVEAKEYVRMIREIFEFRYLDYYNP